MIFFKGRVSCGEYPIENAKVELIKVREGGGEAVIASTRSKPDGTFQLRPDVAPGNYLVRCRYFGVSQEKQINAGQEKNENIPFKFEFDLRMTILTADKREQISSAVAGKRMVALLEGAPQEFKLDWKLRPEVRFAPSGSEIELIVPDGPARLDIEARLKERGSEAEAAIIRVRRSVQLLPAEVQTIGGQVDVTGPLGVRLLRTESCPTKDQALWVAIRNRTHAISFGRYQEFMNRALFWEERSYRVPGGLPGPLEENIRQDLNELGTNLHGIRAYQTLKALTETFLLLECGVRIQHQEERMREGFECDDEGARLGRRFAFEELDEKLRAYLGDRKELPYITRVVKALFADMDREGWKDRLIATKINEPCLMELIWCYWMEEGMLVQAMNVLCQRFQNVRGSSDRNPLANLEIDPLRPLNNLLWGYIQDEPNRLTVRRRAYEYLHQYGLTLYGKAASSMNAADVRSKFLEAFHNLLFQTSVFFKEDYQTTVIADGFPLLNSLKEVHVILAQGAQNQFVDMTGSSRVEMLLMQYMLARREVRDFLQSRAMVPYKEPWEGQVDARKTLQGWTDSTVGNFRDLAVYGEQILLSIRFGDWIGVIDEDSAKNWARYFRPEIYGYLHAYRAVTGIDLTNPDTIDATIPGILLQKRMGMQRTAR